jgi:hypothetical protein
MSTRSLFAVAIGAVGVWFIGNTVALLLANAIGELAYAAVGIALLIVAYLIGRTTGHIP